MSTMNENNNNGLKQKLEFFKKNDFLVHIRLDNGRFFNGKILEVAGDLVIIDDRVLGASPVYFEEIKFVERSKADEKKDF